MAVAAENKKTVAKLRATLKRQRANQEKNRKLMTGDVSATERRRLFKLHEHWREAAERMEGRIKQYGG